MIIAIKKLLCALTTALVMGSSVQSAHAVDIVPSLNITSTDKIGSEWTLVQEIDGISVSFTSIVLGDKRFLSVKFDNTNSESVDFIWSMTKNNTLIVITEDDMIQSRVQLDAHSSMIHDGIYLIELSQEDQFSNFVVSIQPYKH